MTTRSWVRKLFARPLRTAAKAAPRLRPRVESLEDRAVPAVYSVTNTLDDGSAGSLRWAINQANATPVADTIDFHPSLAGATIQLSQVGDVFGALVGNPSAFAITGALTIMGPTASSGGITIARASAAPLMRHFQVYPGAGLTLQNLTLTGGIARGGDGYLGGGGGAGMGGAIFNNQGTLRLENVTLADNAAIGGNSGKSLPNRQQIGGGFGGGPNGGAGGQQYGINLQYDTPITSDSGGHGGFGGGGGAAGNASGIFGAGIGNGGWGGFGGGGGAPSWTYSETTPGSPKRNFYSTPGLGGFGGGNAGRLVIEHVSGSGGESLGSAWGGGGAGMGGAIFNFFGTTIINGSTLAGNSASGGAGGWGGVYDSSDGQGLGGAVFNLNGDFRATNSTISENAAWVAADGNRGPDGYSSAGSRGGGVYNLNGTLAFLNSTIAANRAAGASAIASLGLGLEFLTPGVLWPANSASIDLTNTLVAEAPPGSRLVRGGRYISVPFGPAVALDTLLGGASTATARNSLATSASSPVAGLTIVGDLKLGPLQNNGGPTRTMALLVGSPAIDAGDAAVPGLPGTDQRGVGFARIVGARPDVGAFEFRNYNPTDVVLSNAVVADGQPSGTFVGTLSTIDSNAGDAFTYTLVGGEGDDDNASFTIEGNELKTAASLEFAVQSLYSIRVQSTDAGGLATQKAFTIRVTTDNEPPVDVALSESSVAENQPAGAVVGAFSTTDPNAGDSFTYGLVSGEGDADNDSFSIDADGNLLTTASFDFEARSSYSIRVRSTDAGGLHVEKVFTISVADGNETPTDIALLGSGVAENQPPGAVVGTFSTTDPDAGDAFTYELVSGEGDADNGSFTIDADGSLRTAASFDFEARSSYSIRVKSTDSDGLDTEKVFIISVSNVNETPTDLALSESSVAENQPAGAVVGAFSTTDPDASDAFTYELVSGEGDADNGSFTIDADGNLRTAASFDFEARSSYSIRVRSTDAGGLWSEKAFTIHVTNVNEAPTVTVPGAQTGYEDVDLAIGGITVGDPDGDSLTVTLAVGHGTLTLGTTAGLTFSGNGTTTVTLTGNIANLNAALATLVYRGSLNYSGGDTLSVTASDGSLGTSGSVAIHVKSAAQQAADLCAHVEALHTAGVLNAGQANSLCVKLNLKDNNGDAGKVQAFLNKVAAFLNAGILTQAEADVMLQLGNLLLLSVSRR